MYTRTEKIETLPTYRLKHAFGARLSWYPSDYLITRFFYRYYFDTYNIKAQTISLELPVKISRFFSIYPFYRYYTQTSSKYFKPFAEHDISETYFTSDWDLADLNSQKYGLGLRLSPPLGLWQSKSTLMGNRMLNFKGIELRVGQYRRNDGLHSFIASTNLILGL